MQHRTVHGTVHGPESGFVVALAAMVVAGCVAPLAGPGDAGPKPADAAAAATAVLGRGERDAGTLRVHFVDVGQGDGVIWQLPDGGFVVYDCGPPAASAEANPVVRRLRQLGLPPGAVLHALVSSHGHLDHVGGCQEVLEEYRVLHVYETWYDGSDAPASYKRFRDQLKAEGAVVHVLAGTPALEGEVLFRAGDELALPEEATATGARAVVLWPPAFQGKDWKDIAKSSIAVRLSFGETDFCFQGDLEAAQEQALAQAFPGRDCEVYLTGHHGSRYASSAPWLQAMDPEIAVVSFGTNPYGHPAREAMCRLQAAGAALYFTDRLGTVTVATDGRGANVAPAAPETIDYCAPGATGLEAVTPKDGAQGEEQPPDRGTQPPPPPVTDERVEVINEGTGSVDLTGVETPRQRH
jgi:competence protein ComEC